MIQVFRFVFYIYIYIIYLFIYLGYYYENSIRHLPLVPVLAELFDLDDTASNPFLSFIHCSSFMHSIVSIELDDNCVFRVQPSDEELFFPHSHHITHVSVTLSQFEHCVELLDQLGKQLQSLSVTVAYVCRRGPGILSKLKSASICL